MKEETKQLPQTRLGKALDGTNIYFAALLLVGSLWGLTSDTATPIYAAIMSIVGAFGLVRNWLKVARFRGFSAWAKDRNTLNYAIAVLVGAIPSADALVPGLNDLYDGIISNNLSKIITAGFSILTTIYYLFIKKE